MNIAYIRVSTVEQNEARQLEGLKKYDIDKIFEEKVSAKDTNRPQLKAMLDFAREGDTIYVWDFSRLARSTKDLLNIVEQLESKKINLKSIKENLDTSTPTGKFKGRKPIDYPENWNEVYDKWKKRKMTAKEAMETLKLKRNTFYNLLKKFEEK